MSTRRDLYPEEVCACLSRLQRTTSSHSWRYTRHILETAYGLGWRQVFVEFEQVPVGSGCCAQVHRAILDTEARADRRPDSRPSALVESMIPDSSILSHSLRFIIRSSDCIR